MIVSYYHWHQPEKRELDAGLLAMTRVLGQLEYIGDLNLNTPSFLYTVKADAIHQSLLLQNS